MHNILNRLDTIEKEIGIKPAVNENTIIQLGITTKEFQDSLMQLAQSYKYMAENCSYAEGKMTPVENIKYKFKNGDYITEEDWSWLDKNDINE